MSDFVEQCRLEWRRLGVPDPLAEEMATELAADLREAEADGISAEEFLGGSTFDPPSFAATWAAERGIIPAPSREGSPRRRPFVLVAFTALAAVTLTVAALLLLTGEPKVSLVRSSGARPHVGSPSPGLVLPSGPSRHVLVASTSASAPVEWILLILAIVALGFAAWLWSNWGRPRPSVPAQ